MERTLFEVQATHPKKYIEIISLFKDKIVSGSLRPGDKIPTEMELMENLGMSRTPVREAIKILEAIGIIEIKRGEGMFLRETTSSMNLNPLIMGMILQSGNIMALIEFRQYFEHMAIELAWQHCSPEEYDELLAAHEQLKHSLNVDRKTWVEADLHFHYLIMDTTHNPFIMEIAKTVYGLFRSKMENIERSVTISRENTILTHQLYLKVIKSKNSEDLEKLKQQIKENYANLYLPH